MTMPKTIGNQQHDMCHLFITMPDQLLEVRGLAHNGRSISCESESVSLWQLESKMKMTVL
jgi:hypothetical protein